MEEEEIRIQRIHTSCKNCAFALYNDDLQTDCFAGKLDIFRKQSEDLIVECFDDDKKFYVINGRFCPFYRNESFLEHFKDRDALLEKIRSRHKLPYHLMIMLLPSHPLDGIYQTLDSVYKQDIKPTHLTVINRNPEVVSSKAIVRKIEKYDSIAREWRVQACANLDLSDRDYIDIAIDGTIKSKINFSMYCVFNAGFDIPQWFSKRFNDLIFEDFFSFFFIKPNKDGNGMIVPKAIHNMNNGNAYGRYLENVIGEDECAKKKIYEICQVLPEFPQ